MLLIDHIRLSFISTLYSFRYDIQCSHTFLILKVNTLQSLRTVYICLAIHNSNVEETKAY